MEKQTANRLNGHGERGGEHEMYGKSNINLFVTYGNTLPYVK